jgi:hypothetical protein
MAAETQEGSPKVRAVWRRRDVLFALMAGFAGAGPGEGAAADLPLGMSGRPVRVPPALVLHYFASTYDEEVIEALAQRLRGLFVAPVLLRPAAAVLAEAPQDWRGRYHSFDLLDRLGDSHAEERPLGAFHALILDGRLVTDDLGEAVATGWGNETTEQSRAVLALAGIDAAGQGLSGRARINLTAERAFKHLATAVVFTTGYVSVEPIMAQGIDGRLIDLAPMAPAPVDAQALRLAGLIR